MSMAGPGSDVNRNREGSLKMYAKKKGLLRARRSILTTIGQCAHRPRFGYGPKIGIGKRASFRSSKLTGSRLHVD